jgi:hypothetical protein
MEETMRRVKQRAIRQQLRDAEDEQRSRRRKVVRATKAEIRRVRRGRQRTVQAGQGHGDRSIDHVLSANRSPTFAERAAMPRRPKRGLFERLLG